MLAFEHVAAIRSLLNNYEALHDAAEAAGGMFPEGEGALADLSAAIRLLTDGMSGQARAQVQRASRECVLPFDVHIE